MDQEGLPSPSNPLGLEGVEFIEYSTREPLALGALLQQFGFHPIARHRSREVMLYRQGDMNIIVDAHPEAVRESSRGEAATIGAIAFRVRDAAFAHRRALELGAWGMPTRAAAMELLIPGVHGSGDSLIYSSTGIGIFPSRPRPRTGAARRRGTCGCFPAKARTARCSET